MSLRTYPLIVHPAFLAFVESELHGASVSDSDSPATENFIPRIDKISEITEYLKISHFTVRSILTNIPLYYRSFEITKRDGKKREIHAPRTFLKVIQWWIYDAVLGKYALGDEVHGFRQGRSFISNAKMHLGAQHILNVDVKDFFPSIKRISVEQVFQKFGYSESICAQLTMLCTLRGSLPQGAPTSPAIANIFLQECDQKILDFCNDKGLTYTRYADDLTFSSSSRMSDNLLNFVVSSLREIGLELNPNKTKWMGPNSKQEVTGLILGPQNVNLPLSMRNAARGWFHSLRFRANVTSKDVERLRGTVALINSVGGAGSVKLCLEGNTTISILEDRLAIATTQNA